MIEHGDSQSNAIPLALGGGPPLATVQLATALLRAWAARDDGPNAKESYEQLKSVLEDFFALRLRDSVGETQEYNPILDTDLARVSPLCYAHIIPNGTYNFAGDIQGDNPACNTLP